MFESIDLNSLQQADRLQTLKEIGRAVSSTLDLQTLYQTIYQQIGRVMDTSQFFIALHRPERGTIELPYLREQGALLVDQELPGGSSVTGLVMERGVALHFNSLEEYQLFGMMNGLKDIVLGAADPEAMIFVPLSTGSRTIGALSVQSMRQHAYSQDDVQMLTILASQAAVAIENARLYADSQHNGRNMETLLHIAELVNGSLDLQTVLDSLLVGIRDVIPYYLAGILLPDESRRYLEIVGAVGPDAKRRAQIVKIPVGKGVTGMVFESGKPLTVPNIHEFPGYIGPSGSVRAELAVPLTIGDTVVGVLNLEREDVNSFSPDELHLLSVFASQAAIAIENARLYASQQNRVSDLQTIQSIVQQLTPLHEIPAIAALINQELKLLIDYHICGIFERDETGGQLTPILYHGVDFPFEYLRPGEGLAGWVALHGDPAIVHDSSQDPRVASIPGMQSGANSLISAPLNYEGRVRGVITLFKLGTNQFDENALRLLEIIAAQTAIAFDRARLYDELRTDAITDPVTRLYNRRYLFERFREEQSRAVRNQHPLGALMLDIDKFKRINDQWGHDAGDSVLHELGEVIRGVVRAEDIVARHGGEEFSVLLPETAEADAEGVAERLRAAIAGHGLPEGVGDGPVTVSVGMAMVWAADQGMEVFTRADQAMYAVKHAGGNRVCVAEEHGFRVL